MNARYLERQGYGLYADNLDDPETVRGFLDQVPRYQDKLAGYRQDGNLDLLAALDAQLERVVRAGS